MVFILGGAQSDFARHLSREGGELSTLTGELVDAVLADAEVAIGEIETIHVGNAFGELFAGQAQLGAMPATVRPALYGVPAMRHEAACASGSMALLAASAEIEAGRYECALVLGVEQERNVAGPVSAQHMGAAAWAGHEAQDAKFVWPYMFAKLGEVYRERYGLDRRHLAAFAEQAFANARRNPNAQTRGWAITAATFADDDATNAPVEGMLRRSDCAQVTDGGAAVVVASARFAAQWARARSRMLAQVPRVLGWGHRTAALPLAAKLERAAADGSPDALMFPQVADAMRDAKRRAGIAADGKLDGYEIHDCFTTTAYMAIEHLGLTPPGQAWRAIESGRIARGGDTPINASGGLIGGGHPVGATGVRMIVDAARQVAGRAGDMQIEGARRVGTLNLGGSATTIAAFVVGVGEG